MLKGIVKHLALFFLPSFILLLVGITFGIGRLVDNVHDEGIIAHGALRVLNGEVPYRDFWNLYGPAQFWILAALYKIFGVSLLTERVWDIFVRAMICLFTYLVARRLVSQPLAILAWVLSIAWLWVVGFYGFPLFPALLFVLMNAYFFIDFLSEPARTGLLFLAGFAIGISACFRHDIGAYAFLAEGVMLLVLNYTAPNEDTSRHRSPVSGFMTNLGLYCAGVALAGLPGVSYLLWKVPVSDLWEQFFIYPLTVYPSVRYLPYPSILEPFKGLIGNLNGSPMLYFFGPFVDDIPFYFPFFISGTAATILIRSWRVERHSGTNYWDHERLCILFLVILSSMEFVKCFLRPCRVNLTQVIVLSLILGVTILHGLARAHRKMMICVSLSLVAMAVYLPGAVDIDMGQRFPQTDHSPARACKFIIPSDQAAAIEFIQEHVPKDRKIFVGTGRHDKIYINDVMFYFLAERSCATKFDILAPRQATTAEVQNRIINELIDNAVQYVVLVSTWDNVHEPNRGSESSEIKLLDNFLSTEYAEVAKFGCYTIRKKIAGTVASTSK
jgi:hypothetical protein